MLAHRVVQAKPQKAVHYQSLDIVARQRNQCEVKPSRLARKGKQGELNAHAFWHTTGPHLIASVGIRAFDRTGNSVIPNIHDSIPSNECSKHKCDVLNKWVKDKPVYQEEGQSKENESQAQPH